jgi:putative FmdB family regulatory protein
VSRVRYPFRCPACGLEFVVSRPASDAAAGAACPADGTAAERVFTVPEMNMNRPAPPAGAPRPPARGFSHSGHSHGPGTAAHSH